MSIPDRMPHSRSMMMTANQMVISKNNVAACRSIGTTLAKRSRLTNAKVLIKACHGSRHSW